MYYPIPTILQNINKWTFTCADFAFQGGDRGRYNQRILENPLLIRSFLFLIYNHILRYISKNKLTIIVNDTQKYYLLYAKCKHVFGYKS